MESYLILVFISTVLVTAVLGQGIHLEFNSKMIPNNSVVDYNGIGTAGEGSDLRCVTERMDCCNTSSRTKAEWFTPNESPATSDQWNIYWNVAGSNQKGYISMYRRTSTNVTSVQEGLYYCNIIAVNGDISTFYVGIYTSNNNGRPTISGIMLHRLNPEMFTLTCTSTGGPATNVTWTLNGSVVTYDANHVLTQTVVNTATAEYNNTLTVTGREPGNYQCTVSNARGSDTSQVKIAVLTLDGSEITYDANHVLTQTVVNTRTAEYKNTLTVTGREPGNYQCTVSNTRGSDTSQLLVVNNTEDVTITPSVVPPNTPDSPSSSQLPVVIAGAAVGLILCIILIVVLILALTVCKRRKGTWPCGKKTRGRYSLQQSDDKRSSVCQCQTNLSTGQTLNAQSGDDDIRNTSYLSTQNHTTITDNSDPLYSAVIDTTTLNVDPLNSVVTEPPIPMKCIYSSNSLLTHDEDDQTVGKGDESTFEGDLKSTRQESIAEDEPKTSSGPGDVYDEL